jgi:hypothetical protein
MSRNCDSRLVAVVTSQLLRQMAQYKALVFHHWANPFCIPMFKRSSWIDLIVAVVVAAPISPWVPRLARKAY